MNTLIRWGKFNLVGALGMAVQLAALALFNRWFAGHYLYASAAAIELTLLHNFIWHTRYTWRDRNDGASWLRQGIRFHLSNGLVSMLGNLALMRLFFHTAHLPLLISNIIAILCCSLANFYLGNKWAFATPRNAEPSQAPEHSHPMSIPSLTLALLFWLLSGTISHAQTPEIPNAPISPTYQAPPTPAHQPQISDTYLFNGGVFCGIGASTSPAATKPTASCGAGLTLLPLPIFLEVGVMAPQANRSNLSGYLSLDGSIPLTHRSTNYLPLAIVGYSRLFETGHAIDYGLALALPRFGKQKDSHKSLRIELRDYWTFANPAQHNIMLRIGWMKQESD